MWPFKSKRTNYVTGARSTRELASFVATAIEQILESRGIDVLSSGGLAFTPTTELLFIEGPIGDASFTGLPEGTRLAVFSNYMNEIHSIQRVMQSPALAGYFTMEVDRLAYAMTGSLGSGLRF